MKFASILILFMYWFDSSIANSNDACMMREYDLQTHQRVEAKFEAEYSLFLNGLKKLFWFFQKAPSKKETDNFAQICACVISKRIQRSSYPNPVITKQEFDRILELVEVGKGQITLSISYRLFDLDQNFPSIVCKYNDDKCSVTKGPSKRSPDDQVYNLYISHTDEEGLYFYGVIENVDVEMPAMEAPIETSKT